MKLKNNSEFINYSKNIFQILKDGIKNINLKTHPKKIQQRTKNKKTWDKLSHLKNKWKTL